MTTVTVRDNEVAHRFELEVDGQLAGYERYQVRGDVVELVHTQTMPGYEGQGLARTMVRHLLDDLRAQGRSVRPICPYVRGFIDRNREYVDLVLPDERPWFGLA